MTIPATSHQPPRIVAPDVARGLALFGIAWANLPMWASTDPSMPGATFGGVGPGGSLDQAAVVLSAMFAHVRGLPMFSTLLGFGVGLITVSLWRRGYPVKSAQAVMAKRYAILAGIGAVHCAFLFFGDIILLYSLLALILILLIRLSDRALLITAGLLYALHAVATLIFTTVAGDLMAGFVVEIPDNYPGYMLGNLVWLVGYVFSLPQSATSILPLMILGFVAARKGVHRRPREFEGVLRSWVFLSAAVIIIIGLPTGLSAVGILPSAWEPAFFGANQAFGYLTGPGIAAGVLLACQGLQAQSDEGLHERSLPLSMVIALGKRSMSGYILQSMLFFLICLPFTFGIGAGIGAFAQMMIALGVWITTLVAAWLCELAGKNGPVEAVHRRLSYGPDGLPARFEQVAGGQRR